MKPTTLTGKAIVVFFALSVSGVARLQGQTAGSLTEREIESTETRAALEALLRENSELKLKLQRAEGSVAALQKNLAASNGEAEVLKRKVSELMLRFEALGLDSAGDANKVEQRLLKAVNDLRLADQDRETIKKALLELAEAVIRYEKVAVTTDADARLALEAAVRGASKALGGISDETVEAPAVSASLTTGLVIAVKDDLALVVANLGRKQGVKVGMPFRVLRDNGEVGTVRVVDVRENISGAVIQDLHSASRKIEVGDQLRVGAER